MIYKITNILTSFVIFFSLILFNGNVAKAGFDVGAKSAILYNMDTKEVMYSKNIEEKLPMASTTKIMTGLILFSQPNLDEEFIVDSEAIKVEGSSMGLVEGDVVTLRTLGYGLLLKSGNDAAGAISVKLAGSVENFVDMMNSKAKEIGLLNTNFVTPSGLDNSNHYSTSLDMAKLTAEALKNEEFLKACSSKTAKLKYGNPPYDRTLSNSNKMLSDYEGAIGVKTGFTKKSGRCLVSAANRNGNTLIAVTLNAGDDWNIHRKLLDYGFSMEKEYVLNVEDYKFRVPVKEGEKTVMSARIKENTSFKYITKSANLKEVIEIYDILQAPVTMYQIVGYVKYYYNDYPLKEIPIYSDEEVYIKKEEEVKKGFFKKFLEFFGLN